MVEQMVEGAGYGRRWARPATARTSRGAASQMARAESTLQPMAIQKDLGRNGANDGGEAIAEHALRGDHEIEQCRRRSVTQEEQRQVTEREAQAAHGPHPLAPDPV